MTKCGIQKQVMYLLLVPHWDRNAHENNTPHTHPNKYTHTHTLMVLYKSAARANVTNQSLTAVSTYTFTAQLWAWGGHMSMQCTHSDTHYEHRVQHMHTPVRTIAMKMKIITQQLHWFFIYQFDLLLMLFCSVLPHCAIGALCTVRHSMTSVFVEHLFFCLFQIYSTKNESSYCWEIVDFFTGINFTINFFFFYFYNDYAK